MKVISKQRNSRMCFICGMDNPIGLKAQFYNMEDGSVMTPFRMREDLQSFPERTHGGITATMLDELGLRALWSDGKEDRFGVTTSINVKYRKPVRYDEDLIGKGKVIKETNLAITTRAEIFNKRGELLANADVVYLKLPVEKINKNVDASHEMPYLIHDNVTEINFEN